jgi:hypothetical protein
MNENDNEFRCVITDCINRIPDPLSGSCNIPDADDNFSTNGNNDLCFTGNCDDYNNNLELCSKFETCLIQSEHCMNNTCVNIHTDTSDECSYPCMLGINDNKDDCVIDPCSFYNENSCSSHYEDLCSLNAERLCRTYKCSDLDAR